MDLSDTLRLNILPSINKIFESNLGPMYFNATWDNFIMSSVATNCRWQWIKTFSPEQGQQARNYDKQANVICSRGELSYEIFGVVICTSLINFTILWHLLSSMVKKTWVLISAWSLVYV